MYTLIVQAICLNSQNEFTNQIIGHLTLSAGLFPSLLRSKAAFIKRNEYTHLEERNIILKTQNIRRYTTLPENNDNENCLVVCIEEITYPHNEELSTKLCSLFCRKLQEGRQNKCPETYQCEYIISHCNRLRSE